MTQRHVRSTFGADRVLWQIEMPQYDSTNKKQQLGGSNGGATHCGFTGKQGVATRFAASKNVQDIKAAVNVGLEVGESLVIKFVLATGYTANESGIAAAAANDITLLDLRVMQRYWVSRLRECTSPYVDHFRLRPAGTGK